MVQVCLAVSLPGFSRAVWSKLCCEGNAGHRDGRDGRAAVRLHDLRSDHAAVQLVRRPGVLL